MALRRSQLAAMWMKRRGTYGTYGYAKNLMAKMRTVENPYEVWKDNQGAGFEYRVLKKYQAPETEATNPAARWFVAGKSPLTGGSWEFGDMYVSEIKKNMQKVSPGTIPGD